MHRHSFSARLTQTLLVQRQYAHWLAACKEQEEDIAQSMIMQHRDDACVKDLTTALLRWLTHDLPPNYPLDDLSPEAAWRPAKFLPMRWSSFDLAQQNS